MARGGRCPACDEELVGAARFCAACGTPVGAGSLTVAPNADEVGLGGGQPLVRDGSRWPMWAGVLVVAGLVAALALSRIGDDSSSAAEPPPETTAAPATTSTTTTTTTSTTIPTTTSSVPPGFVDVSEVPADLADTTLILFGPRGEVSALDLGTGAVTPIESEVSFAGDAQLTTSPLGILQRRWLSNGEEITVVDWSFEELATLGSLELGPTHESADGDLWAMLYDDELTLARLTPTGELRTARSLTGWTQLIGTVGDDALVSSGWSGSVHRVGVDGGTEVIEAQVGLAGGRDWILTGACTQSLACSTQLFDLASGDDIGLDLPGNGNWMSQIASSWDGRRALLLVWGRDEPDRLVLVDADEMTVTTLTEGGDSLNSFGPSQNGYGHDLRYGFTPRESITITELSTGDEIELETEDNVRNVLVAPPGWEPPGSAD